MKRAIVSIFLFLLVPLRDVAFAQTAPLRLTLDEAIARGLEASHRLEELGARQDAARAIEEQREAAQRPQLAAIASYTRTNHVEEFSVPNASGGVRVIYPDVPDNVRSRIDLQWPIYTGGRLQALTRAAGAEAEAAGQDREAARADLKLEITRAFWAVMTARASLRCRAPGAGAHERASHRRAQSAERRARAAERRADDRGAAGASADAQHRSREPRRDDVGRVQEACRSGPGRAVRAARRSACVGTRRLPAAAVAIQPLSRLASTRRAPIAPSGSRSLFRIDAADERVAAASAGSLPVLTAIGGYDMARPNPRIFPIQEKWKPSWDIGVNVRWSLFDGGRVRAETAEAAANRRATEARLRDFDAGVEVEVRQRTADLDVCRARRSRRPRRAFAPPRKRAACIAERFSAGVATNTDVLTRRPRCCRPSSISRARARTRELAGARLDRALGR